MKVFKHTLLIIFSITIVQFGFSQDLSPFKSDNGLYGYKNNKGQVVIKAQYSKATPFQKGMAKVTKDGQNIYIDQKGEEAQFTVVDTQTMPLGGLFKYYDYVKKSLKYPEAARKNRIQGRVMVQFVVEKDGSLTELKVAKGLSYGCDEKAIRVMKNGPKWTPAKYKGESVRVRRVIPIPFSK